jgi:hypothetical protein
VIGYTVLDPSITISPLSFASSALLAGYGRFPAEAPSFVPPPPPPHATASIVALSATAATHERVRQRAIIRPSFDDSSLDGKRVGGSV